MKRTLIFFVVVPGEPIRRDSPWHNQDNFLEEGRLLTPDSQVRIREAAAILPPAPALVGESWPALGTWEVMEKGRAGQFPCLARLNQFGMMGICSNELQRSLLLKDLWRSAATLNLWGEQSPQMVIIPSSEKILSLFLKGERVEIRPGLYQIGLEYSPGCPPR